MDIHKHIMYNWQVGASQPSRTTGTIYVCVCVSMPAAVHIL